MHSVEDRSHDPTHCIKVRKPGIRTAVLFISENEYNKVHELGHRYKVHLRLGQLLLTHEQFTREPAQRATHARPPACLRIPARLTLRRRSKILLIS
jgi:hypothetical protein